MLANNNNKSGYAIATFSYMKISCFEVASRKKITLDKLKPSGLFYVLYYDS